MKKIMSFLLFCGLVYFGYSQEVAPIQHTLVTKITASWCINCGTWGWDAHEGIIDKNPAQALIISAHYSGDLQTNTSRFLSTNFNSFGQPQFFLNNTNTRMNAVNSTEKSAEILAAVQSNALQTPMAGTATTHQIEGDVLSIKTKVAFFQDREGAYFLAHYILENGVLNEQTGQNGIVAHKKVMRGATTREDFGIPITDNQMTVTQDYILSEDWNADNLEILSVIWKQEEDKYQFVNGSLSSLGMDSMEEETKEEETTSNPDGPSPMGNTPDFPEFPWIAALLDDMNCCDHSSITVYNSGIFQFVYIKGEESCSENMGTLYFQDGTFYCSDSPSMDCRAAYGLTEEASSWACSGTSNEEEMNEEEETMEEETKTPNFDEFPWLYDLVDTENCCNNTKVTAYYSSIYTYIFVEANSSCADQPSQLYFQDGTFYCSDANGMDCRAAYELGAERSSVLWTCN